MQLFLTTHMTLNFRSANTLLDWHSISGHEVACGFNLIPIICIQFLQEEKLVITSLQLYLFCIL